MRRNKHCCYVTLFLSSCPKQLLEEKKKKTEIHGKQEKKRWQEKFKHIRSLLRQITELSVAIKRISDQAKNLQLGAISMYLKQNDGT